VVSVTDPCGRISLSTNDLKQSTTTAVASVGEDMLRCDWNELDYRIGIFRGTNGSDIEHLKVSHTNLKIY
jgi:hypothetical protein